MLNYLFLIFIICFNISSSFSFGGYKRDNIKSLSPLVCNAVKLAMKSVIKKSYYFGVISTTPILLYKQIVNGINYKVITVIREKDTAVFYEDVIYTGPFGSNVTQSEIVYEEEIVTVYNKVSEKTKRKIFELAQNWTNLQIVELNIISFREGNDVIYAGVIDAKNRNVIDGRKSLIIILENNGDYEVIYYE